MGKQTKSYADVESLVKLLESEDGATRLRARMKLVAFGEAAAPRLTRALRHSRLDQVRWEAAKALGAIGDPRAIPALVKALNDSNPDVAWLAAEGLKKSKKAAWPPLLRMLMKDGAGSALLRQGAHHVLQNQKVSGFNDVLAALRNSLEPGSLPESTTVAAYDILKRMRGKP